ncbi:MAG: hydrolase 1, exosortase A system-associated, partial [Gammaproteobacteria bacterium]
MSSPDEEQAIAFAIDGDTAVGVLHAAAGASATGVVVIVGGPQTRVGSHRQFVLLARRLAAAGYPVLRFDYRDR